MDDFPTLAAIAVDDVKGSGGAVFLRGRCIEDCLRNPRHRGATSSERSRRGCQSTLSHRAASTADATDGGDRKVIAVQIDRSHTACGYERETDQHDKPELHRIPSSFPRRSSIAGARSMPAPNRSSTLRRSRSRWAMVSSPTYMATTS